MGRSPNRDPVKFGFLSERRRNRSPTSRSRSRRRLGKEREKAEKAREEREQLEMEEIAMRIETEVQRRVQERTATPEFESAVQDKLEQEVDRHFSLLAVEFEMKTKKLVDEFKQARETEERSKHELEEIIRVNQRRAQEQQQKFAEASAMTTDDLLRERELATKKKEQRKKMLQQQAGVTEVM
mmetsp:Transcript_8870/g.23772  ORF Transcript_8870/g.23772 Transcript_8870/m.23772 type:complete len:183 (+) Transcript_8870:66-614(+)